MYHDLYKVLFFIPHNQQTLLKLSHGKSVSNKILRVYCFALNEFQHAMPVIQIISEKRGIPCTCNRQLIP